MDRIITQLGGECQQGGSHPVLFNGYLSTHKHLTDLRNKPGHKSRQGLTLVPW